MKIATMATGGIGGFLAVKLALSGHQVATIARTKHLEEIKANGLTLEGPNGRETIHPWIATDDPSEVGEVDVIIFGIKGDGLDVAAKACPPMLGKDTVVVPFSNGVEAYDRLVVHLPAHNVAKGVAGISTTISQPGVIKQTGKFCRFVFAESDNQPSKRIKDLQNAINEAGAKAPVTDDIDRDLWSKFILFSAFSGVTTTGRCTAGDIVSTKPLEELFKGLVAETAAVGRARGVALSNSVLEDTWATLKGLPLKMRASTAIDLEHERPLEIEWVSGAVKRLAIESGVDAPLNSALYALLSIYKHGREPEY